MKKAFRKVGNVFKTAGKGIKRWFKETCKDSIKKQFDFWDIMFYFFALQALRYADRANQNGLSDNKTILYALGSVVGFFILFHVVRFLAKKASN